MAFVAQIVMVNTRRSFLTTTALSLGSATSKPAFSRSAFFKNSYSSPQTNSLLPSSLFGRTMSNSCSAISSSTLASNDIEKLEKTLSVTHPAFDTVATDIVTEYGAYCTLYKHKQSGAELLSVASDDDNKVFGITFRTPPEDSTGVPHILEHSVLCGSRKYKTKDPFVQLLQGSLQTFLNAFTYPDRTCYVVASQNQKDFYNLVNVYTDAVYYPRAITDRNVHAQEGWHLELEKKEDPLTYKGVVYNEMKGVYSSPDSVLYRCSQRSLFPDNTYAVDSGGDPKVIPDLSYEQFVEFHSKFYHPGNSRIYFSGDDDVLTRLELMDEYLKDFGPSPESKPLSTVHYQKKNFVEPKYSKFPYPASESQEQETHMVMMNWLLNEKEMTATEELTSNILDHLLMGTTQSILRKTLMESQLGEAIVGGGLSDELLQATFAVGLKGVKPDDVNKVQELILNTLEKAALDGFEEDAIAASLNTIEFSMREFNTGSFPKGLSFMLGAMSKWIYDGSPTDALKFEEPLAEIKQSIQDSGSKIFQDMITDLLVKNKHRSTIELVPSKTLEQETEAEEKERLEKIKQELSDDELDQIIENTSQLKALQASEDSAEDRATIPSLELNDLKKEVTEYPIEVTENENESGITVLRHELTSTSGILYADFAVDLSALSFQDLPLLSLFTRLMKENGAGDLSDVALSRRIGTFTGGISVSLGITPVKQQGVDENVVTDGSCMTSKLYIRGKATTDNTHELFEMFQLLLTEANFDNQSKVLEMLKESKSRLESGIQGSGHQYAQNRLKSRYSPNAYISEAMGGITYLETVKQLLEQAENDWPSLLERFENMRKTMLSKESCRDGMILNLTGDKQVLDKTKEQTLTFLQNLPGDASPSKPFPNFYKEEHPWITAARSQMNTELQDEGFIVPTQVSYVGKGGRLYKEGEAVPGTTAVISKFLRTGYLWDNVRVIGGAYGGFCTFDANDGLFTYLSYRDPNLADTLDVYDRTSEALMESAKMLAQDENALATAIIGTIGDMDSVLSPDQKGFTSMQRWLKRESPEKRQQFRNEILECTAEDFEKIAERLSVLAKEGSVAVVSSKSAFEEAEKKGKKMVVKEIV